VSEGFTPQCTAEVRSKKDELGKGETNQETRKAGKSKEEGRIDDW
jgi:hypothetical protein